jgi:hypothetical protein
MIYFWRQAGKVLRFPKLHQLYLRLISAGVLATNTVLQPFRLLIFGDYPFSFQ